MCAYGDFVEKSMKRSLEQFRCDDDATLPPSKRQLKPKPEFKDLAPSLGDNLKVIFVGFNPGHQLLITQHHYAHFTNRFWKLFNQADILHTCCDDVPDKFFPTKPEHDYDLVPFGVGFTDLVLRCTRRADELSEEEKIANIERLFREFRESDVAHVAFIGKGIWEVVVRYVCAKQPHLKYRQVMADFEWGVQRGQVAEYVVAQCHPTMKMHVFPSTLGLVTALLNDERLKLWQRLAEAIKQSGPKLPVT